MNRNIRIEMFIFFTIITVGLTLLFVVSCQTPYSGILGPKDFNGWIESETDEFVCIWNGFDRICVQSVVGKDGKDGKDGSDGKDGKDGQTLIVVHEKRIEIIVEKIIETVVIEEFIKEVLVEVVTERVVTEFIDREVEIEVFVERTVEIIKEVLVEIEVIKEVPVNVIVEVIKTVYVEVPVEVIVEVIKTVYVEVPVGMPLVTKGEYVVYLIEVNGERRSGVIHSDYVYIDYENKTITHTSDDRAVDPVDVVRKYIIIETGLTYEQASKRASEVLTEDE